MSTTTYFCLGPARPYSLVSEVTRPGAEAWRTWGLTDELFGLELRVARRFRQAGA